MPKRGEHIRKRKDGRWEGRYVEKQNGQSKTRSVYAKTYSEVKQKLLLAKYEITCNVDTQENISGISLQEVAAEWLLEIKESRKHTTYVKYYSTYQKHIQHKLGSLPLKNLTTEDVCSCISQNLSVNTTKSIYCVLNQIVAYGSNHYHIPALKLNRTVRYTRTEPVKVLNLKEQNQLIQYLNQDMDIYKLGIYLCLSTGLRLGEICALQWMDIDMDNHMLYVCRTVQRVAVENEKTRTRVIERNIECHKK